MIEILMDPLRDNLSPRGLQFAVARNFISYHATYAETISNYEGADILLINYITCSKLDGKRVWVYASDVNPTIPCTKNEVFHLGLLQ